ncbi:MAG: protein phosphatase 2C domain-containing protein [Pyrinomonadaceae bacterium]|nr:protein phosphatase 2C domain-containing protein [Pyrinomonadaceae bacterium]
MNLTAEQIAGAIRWWLGLEADGDNAKGNWKEIEDWVLGKDERLDEFAAHVAWPLIDVIQRGIVQSKESGNDRARTCWDELKSFLKKQDELSRQMVDRATQFLDESTTGKGYAPVYLTQPPETPEAGEAESAATAVDQASAPSTVAGGFAPASNISGAAVLDEVDTVPAVGPPQPYELEAAPASDDESNKASNPMSDQTESTSESMTPSAASTQWQYKPLPNEPENHGEYETRAEESYEKLKIIGARVRGKKHKHEGTNCDDWFEFDTSSPWTIIAVSDGAGSKRLSRIGAKVSCQRAVEVLRERLKEHFMGELDWSNLAEVFKQDREGGVFIKKELDTVRSALHEAMLEAYKAVEDKARELSENSEYTELMGRPVTLDDLAGTLLLAAHTGVPYDGKNYSFVMTCQIGDGMLAAIDQAGALKLLGIADSGEFAGQTEFLISKKKLEKNNLWSKTNGFWGELRALMVMTDGVADDYFPNAPTGMLKLYGDLVLNSILRPNFKDGMPDINASLAGTELPNPDAVQAAALAVPVETISAEPQTVYIRSIDIYAKKLDRTVEEIIKDPGLLLAGGEGQPMCAENEPKDRLRIWLDSYQVRGSFDDRTLVVLYREEM